MRSATIRSRADGITELVPALAPPDPTDRLAVIVTVLFVTGGLFLSGMVPARATAAVGASCIAGEIVLRLKAVALALRRPRAPVHELRRRRAR